MRGEMSLGTKRRIRMQTVSYADKEETRFKRGRGWKINLFGQNSDVPTADLQAFRIDMSADMVLEPHLHIVDQFQVFMAGSGKIGPDRTDIVTAHYADHHTAYGPIVAETNGMSYLTLRSKTDAGMIKVKTPNIRSFLRPTKRRHRVSTPITLSIPPVLRHREAIEIETVMEQKPGDDGMTAKVYRMGSGARTMAPATTGNGGYYVIVMNGSLECGKERLLPWSLLFVPAGDHAPELVAGDEGLEVLVTIFPEEDEWMQALGPDA